MTRLPNDPDLRFVAAEECRHYGNYKNKKWGDGQQGVKSKRRPQPGRIVIDPAVKSLLTYGK